LEVIPPIDIERDPGDLPRLVGEKEAHGGRDVLRLRQSTDGEL
jgi:hypothetical protein